jgi:hypothetical protein
MAHTKGEWKLEDNQTAKGSTAIIAEQGNERKMIADTRINAYVGATSDEVIANATMMAASKDMYEALNDLLKASNEAGIGNYDPEVLIQARKALEKARGEAKNEAPQNKENTAE